MAVFLFWIWYLNLPPYFLNTRMRRRFSLVFIIVYTVPKFKIDISEYNASCVKCKSSIIFFSYTAESNRSTFLLATLLYIAELSLE